MLLADVEAMTFTSLKQLLKETDGNLGAHLRKLEGRRLPRCVQALREPQAGDLAGTRLTDKGFRAPSRAHLEALQTVIRGGEALR